MSVARRQLWHVVAFTLAVLILSVWMTYPLVTDLAGAVPGPPGDNFEYVYKLWWFAHAIAQGQSPFFVPNVFFPFGYEIALSETTLANVVLGLPIVAAAGEVVAYNLLLLWSFVLSGLGAYLYTRYVTRNSMAAVLAGLIFAFLPYRMAHVGDGHLPLMGTGWLPFILLYVERLVQRRRARDGLLAGVFYALFALSSWYYAYMGALITLIYALLRARPWRSYLSDVAFWRGILAGGAVAALMLLPAALPLLSLAGRGEMARSTLSLRYVDQWSASLADFILPSILNPLWGERIVQLYAQNIHENLLWLGFAPLALAGYAIIRRRTRVVGTLTVIGLLAVILALGTTLHWAGQPVYIPVSAAIENGFSRLMYVLTGKLALNPASYASMQEAGQIPVPLPTLLLYLFLPFFNAMRVWARFGLVAGLVVALLAGAGTAGLLGWRRWTSRSRAALFVFLVAAVLFEFNTAPYAFGLSAVGSQPVDEWLQAQAGAGAILELPVEKTWHGPALYAASRHGKPIAYGYGTYMPKDYAAWQQRLADFPDADSLRAIREAGVRYILVGLYSYGEREWAMRQALAESPHLRLVATFAENPVLRGDRLLNLVQPSPLVPPTELIGDTRYGYLADEIAVYELVD